MKKILLVDDNKMLGKLLAKKIQNTLEYEVDIANNFAEAKQLSQNDYFLAFVDLCLPDAPHGEIVDFMTEKYPTIVLTASNDKATKEKFANKDILEYIHKESDSCVDQILNAIITLKQYEKTKVILAMSKLNERNQIKKYLTQRYFNVLAAAHGEEAISYLNDNADVGLIICDFQMPVIDGMELLEEVRSRFGKDEVGVVIMGEKNDALEVELLRKEANDYLVKPLNRELFNYRLDRCLKQMAELEIISLYYTRDSVSGLKNSDILMHDIEDYMNEIGTKEEEFALAFLDIDNLRVINDEYGYQIGDKVIKTCANEIINETKGRDIIGRYSAEKICILLKNINSERAIKIFSRIRVNIKNVGVLAGLDELFFTASIGVVFGNSGDKIEQLIQKASDALSLAKTNGKDRVEVCS